ncbi:MAG: hypothetical protein V4506_18635 [Bacteroidota bacterium]
MKLNCPKCSTEIPNNQVNFSEGIGRCIKCDEYFKIANYLRNSEEIRRIKKPLYSNITIDSNYNTHKITVPPAGWTGSTFFFLLFAGFWNIGVFFAFFNGLDFKTGLFLVPFVIIGIGTATTFFLFLRGITVIEFNKENISVTWQLFGLKYKRTRNSRDLDRITEDVIYNKNYQPVYGIGLFFRGDTKLKFGSNLKEEERKWLIGELHEFKTKFSMDKGSQRNNSL